MNGKELKTQLGKEIRSLCESNSSVMTYMECLMKRYEQLQSQLQQKENIIKEVREYIESYNLEYLHETNEHNLADILEELLEILDKYE